MTTSSQGKRIGARIRQARRTMPHTDGRRISQEAFSRRIGVHWVTVSTWERGEGIPSVENLLRIAQVTGHSLDFFTGGSDDEEEAAREMQIQRGLEILDDLKAALIAARDRDVPEKGAWRVEA